MQSRLVRILKSLVSDSGELFKKIQECEKEVQKDAETAEKEGWNIPPPFCRSFKLTKHLIYIQLPESRVLVYIDRYSAVPI